MLSSTHDSGASRMVVECDPRRQTAQPNMCDARGLRAYPTWEINERLIEGTISLRELARLSNYQPAAGGG